MNRTTSSSFACLFFIGALLHVIVAVAVAVEHQVGGPFGWNLPPTPTFFSEWASSRTFFVGDKLIFKSSANESHTIVESRFKSEFDGCIKPKLDIVYNSFVVLYRPGPYYFISINGDDCDRGMKFAIDVLPNPRTMPNSAVKAGALPVFLFVTIMANQQFFI